MTNQATGYRLVVAMPMDPDCTKAMAHDLYCACGKAIRYVGPEADVIEAVRKWQAEHSEGHHAMLCRREFEERRSSLYKAMGWWSDRNRRQRRTRHCRVATA